jgi:hypothetical protein
MNRITLLAAAALAAGLAATGLGVANAVNTIPPGTLHGCITGTTRTMEHVYANPSSGTTCTTGTLVWWPNGADKDQPLTTGPAGLATTVVSNTAKQFVTVQCPAAEPFVIGGGGEDATISGIPLSVSDPWDFTHGTAVSGIEQIGNLYGWRVDSSVINGNDANNQVTADAICAK